MFILLIFIREVVSPIIIGEKPICLAISEPVAGSDVANIKTTAEKTDFHVAYINGSKSG